MTVNQMTKETTWDIGFERLPEITFSQQGDSVDIRNIRNFRYSCESGHEECWDSRSYSFSETCRVDFIVVPFVGRSDLAHTMVSFGFRDGRHLVISVEARRAKNQPYSVMKGLFRAFPIMYVIADERDAIGQRIECRGDTVHLYRSSATAHESACFFRAMVQRAEALSRQREYYNTLLNNCLTNLRRHINDIWPGRVPWRSGVLLTGHADYLAYQLGLLSSDESFESTRENSAVNELAKGHWQKADFSKQIRSRETHRC